MPEHNSQHMFEGAERMARMWNDFASRMAAAGLAISPEQTPPEATRAMRDAMLNAMGEMADQYMRTPEFRELMKQTMRQSIHFRRQLNEYLGLLQHELQGASRQDMDQLMQGLSHLETRLINEMERMSERLDDLAARLDALERGSGSARKNVKGVKKDSTKPRGKSSKARTAKKKNTTKKTTRRH